MLGAEVGRAQERLGSAERLANTDRQRVSARVELRQHHQKL